MASKIQAANCALLTQIAVVQVRRIPWTLDVSSARDRFWLVCAAVNVHRLLRVMLTAAPSVLGFLMLWNVQESYVNLLCAGTLASIDRVKKVAGTQTANVPHVWGSQAHLGFRRDEETQ